MKSLLLLALITTLVTGCNDSANGVPTGSTAVPLNASEKIAGQAVQATAPTDQDVLTFDQTQGIWVTKKIEVAQVNDLQNNLDAKANSVDVQSQELAINQNVALKANSVDVATGLSQKVDATDYATNNTAVQAAIDTKANTSDVNTALATKVDATAYTANNTAVANTIATNQTSTTTALATKVDATAYATNNAAVAASISNNQTSTNNALSAKLDKDGGTLTGDLQLANKDAPTETTAVQAYAVADKGKTWFNTVLNALKFWDGNTTKTVSTTDDISASEAVTNQAIATKADSASLGALAEKARSLILILFQ
jgi:putative ubiquitin-RnfH superfamily antitoxin RatB of RatAB toxin-antitoxin module